MRCVVTGAAGFVGSTLCDRLLSLGHSVVGVDCFINYYPREAKLRNLAVARDSRSFRFLELDLSTADLLPLVRESDWIFHQAGQAGVRASWGDYFQTYCTNNIVATQRLLETVRSVPSVKKVVFASSSSVYGDAETYPTSERVLPRPVSPYGVTKLAAEHLMSLYASQFNVPTISLRYFTVFGPRQRPDMAFHRFIRAALTGDEIQVFGDGEQSRDFTFIDDIVQANIQAAQCAEHGAVLNIGGGCFATVNQVLEIVEALTGKLRISRGAAVPGEARRTSADTTRARDLISFRPGVDLRNGLSREVEWLRRELKA